MEIPVEITEKAQEEIRLILDKKGIPEKYGLRLGVRGTHGCAGVSFTLGFDIQNEQDITYQIGSLNVHVRKAELMYLVGKKVDFYEGADARGFVFINDDHPDNSTEAL